MLLPESLTKHLAKTSYQTLYYMGHPTQNSLTIILSDGRGKKVCTECHINTNEEAILLGKEEDIKMLGKEVLYELLVRKLGILKQIYWILSIFSI